MPRATTRWRTLLLVVLSIGLGIGALSLTLLFTQSTLDVQRTDRGQALAQLDAVRSRFGNAVPCVDAGAADGGAADAPRTDTRRSGVADGRGRIETVHVLAWERDDERLVHASTPHWVLRIVGWKAGATQAIVPALRHVSIPQIDHCGRGLILDRRTAGGGRVLIWAD